MNGGVKDGEAYAKFARAETFFLPSGCAMTRAARENLNLGLSRGYYDAEQILFDSRRGRFIAGGV